MRAKELWALVPVPSHVVKKVVSACPDRHVDCLCTPKHPWHSNANNLGLILPTPNVLCSWERVREGYPHLAITATNPWPFAPTLFRICTDNTFLTSSTQV